MVLDAAHPPVVVESEREVEVDPDPRRPGQPKDPVALARKMAAAAHRMVRQALADPVDDDDVLDDELGLRRLHNPDGEE